jgi:integrase
LSITKCKLGAAKTKSSINREVPMTDDLVTVLRAQRLKVLALERKLGREIPIVFPNPKGGFENCDNMRPKMLYPAQEKLGLPKRTFHDMRHTYASLRLGKGHAIEEVSRHLGHSSTTITFRVYYKWIPTASIYDINDIAPEILNEALEARGAMPKDIEPQNDERPDVSQTHPASRKVVPLNRFKRRAS